MIDTAAVVASADLVNQAGGRGFQIGWTCPHVPDEEDGHNCPDVTWYAHAQWKGSRLTVEGHPDPGAAATALAVRVLDGGRCRVARGFRWLPARQAACGGSRGTGGSRGVMCRALRSTVGTGVICRRWGGR